MLSTMQIVEDDKRRQPAGLVGRLKRYAPIVLLLETMGIIAILAYLLWLTKYSINPNEQLARQLKNNENFDLFRVYSSAGNSSKFLLALKSNCNQRTHDLKFGVKCESSKTSACQHQIPTQEVQLVSGQVRRRRSEKEPIGQQEPSSLVATQIQSTKSGQRFSVKHFPMAQINCKLEDCKHKTKLLINLHAPEQEIIGWGGALSDSSINNILSLSTNGTAKLLDDYYGEEGLKYNLIRITIGGSDFSSRFYTNDELDRHESIYDFELEKFKLMEEDVLYKIPILKLIQREYEDEFKDRNGMKLFASMWSPPLWMKTNWHFNKGQMKGHISDEPTSKFSYYDEIYFQTLANLKKKFLLTYMSESINFWGLTVMNEPLFAIQPFLDFNTMIFPQNDYANYVRRYLGPTIRDESRLKHLKIIAHDDNRRFLINFTEPILARKEVKQFINGVSTHGYIDEDYHLMSKVYKKYRSIDKDFFILPTELCSAHLPFMQKALIGNWDRAIHYGLDIIHSLQNYAAGWVDWNMALDTNGGPAWLGGRLDSPIIVDKANDCYYKSPMYYSLGQFSRYIPPRSIRLKTVTLNDHFNYQFETVTFQSPNGKDLITVVLNNNPHSIDLYLKQVDKNDGDETFHKVTCAPDSITTFSYSKLAA